MVSVKDEKTGNPPQRCLICSKLCDNTDRICPACKDKLQAEAFYKKKKEEKDNKK